jgi:YD repeat-containing protein
MGETRLYYYEDPNDPHNLTRIIDENWDDYTTFNYDNNDRAVLSRKAEDANQIHVDYSGDFSVKVTNSFSEISEYTREIKDGMGYITSISKAQESGGLCSTCAPIGSYEYSDVHTIEGITDARGYESSFSYDDWGNILSKTQAVGTENVRTTTYTYVGAS